MVLFLKQTASLEFKCCLQEQVGLELCSFIHLFGWRLLLSNPEAVPAYLSGDKRECPTKGNGLSV